MEAQRQSGKSPEIKVNYGHKSTKLEFLVRMKCEGCANAVQKVLSKNQGIKSYAIDLGSEQVIVETTLPSDEVQNLIESTGRQAVLQGMGSGLDTKHLGAAVAMMAGEGVVGVIRLVQLNEDICAIDGTLDGLSPGNHLLNIHEFGDISQGCHSCGEVLSLYNNPNYGTLRDIEAEKNGRSMFRFETNLVKVWDIIGRSIVLSSPCQRIACGIIARSSGIFENDKRICACDGVTVWEERLVPPAGDGRQKNLESSQPTLIAQL